MPELDFSDLGAKPAVDFSDLGAKPASAGPLPSEKPPSYAPPAGGFWENLVNRVNPIPALKDWWNRPSQIADAVHAAGVLRDAAMRNPANAGKHPGQWQSSPQTELTDEERASVDKGMRANLQAPEGNFLGETTEPAVTATRQAAQGNLAGAAGTLAGGYAVPAALPAVTKGIVRGVGSAIRADPYIATTRALRPVPSDPGFPERIPQTLSAVKAANPGFQPQVAEGKLNLIPATQQAIAAHQEALQPWIDRAKGYAVSGDPIVKATVDATKKMLPSESDAAQSLIERAQTDYGHDFTAEGLRDRLALLNDRLRSFYDQSPSRQSAALADIPEAVVKAQRDAVANTLYNFLDPEGEGAGPRLIQSRTGDLIDLRKAAERRQNAILAEQPLSLVGRLTDPVKQGIRHVVGGKYGAGLAYAEGSEGRSIPMLKRAFKAVPGEIGELPQPPSDFYPTVSPQRRLGSGPIVTPPPADTSEFNVTTGQPLTAPLNRQLPKGSIITPPPEDTSGITVTPAQKQVGRNPRTGRMFRYYTSDTAQPIQLTPEQHAFVVRANERLQTGSAGAGRFPRQYIPALAEQSGLTPEQVISQLQTMGYQIR